MTGTDAPQTADIPSPQEIPIKEPDNWVHRSNNMRCYTCMWFVEKKTDVQKSGPAIGRCRRHAPTMNGWPVMFSSDWCGDHKLNENRC